MNYDLRVRVSENASGLNQSMQGHCVGRAPAEIIRFFSLLLLFFFTLSKLFWGLEHRSWAGRRMYVGWWNFVIFPGLLHKPWWCMCMYSRFVLCLEVTTFRSVYFHSCLLVLDEIKYGWTSWGNPRGGSKTFELKRSVEFFLSSL